MRIGISRKIEKNMATSAEKRYALKNIISASAKYVKIAFKNAISVKVFAPSLQCKSHLVAVDLNFHLVIEQNGF
jgi:hypothetical protein